MTIFERKLNNDFATQRNFGLSKANNEWVLFVDADEEVTQELKNEIDRLVPTESGDTNAYYVRRRDYFWNQELKYGEVRQSKTNWSD